MRERRWLSRSSRSGSSSMTRIFFIEAAWLFGIFHGKLDDSLLNRVKDQLGKAAVAELVHDVRPMGLNRFHADSKLLCDLSVSRSIRHQADHFKFPTGQVPSFSHIFYLI